MPSRQVGAISAMNLIAEPIPQNPPEFERGHYVHEWLSDESSVDVRAAALEYLRIYGIASDISAIQKELRRNYYRTRAVAANAIVRIYARDSRERAFAAVLELRETNLDGGTVREIFSNDAEFSTADLLKGIGHPNSEVRCAVTKALHKRRELPAAVADQLMSDNDPTVRYEALMSAAETGRQFTLEQSKNILVKTVPTGLFGFGGQSVTQGEDYYKKFQVGYLRALEDKQLERAVAADQPLDITSYLVFAERHFQRLGKEVRKALDNQFKSEFEGWVAEFQKRQGDELTKSLRSLESVLCPQFTRQALDLICRMSHQEDLPRVRAAINNGIMAYSSVEISYLEKHGEWSDISRIVGLLEVSHRGGNCTRSTSRMTPRTGPPPKLSMH